MKNKLRKIYWKLPIPLKLKKKIRSFFIKDKTRDFFENSGEIKINLDNSKEYLNHILKIPENSNSYVEYEDKEQLDVDLKLIAYYLPQFHPTDHNNMWWGPGTTEWTNVTKSISQYVGHYQPRLPSELGFYDLRIKDNIKLQIKYAKNYGVSAFSFYYYWFDGERSLDKPLNLFLENKDLDIEYCLCWCNEDWTKRYTGLNNEVLLSINKTFEGYKRFIHETIYYLDDDRYLKIDDRLVLIIYRPSEIPELDKVINYWNDFVYKKLGKGLYLIASEERNIKKDWTKYGFDSNSQFHPASSIDELKKINAKINFIRNDFTGDVYDYNDVVEQQKRFLLKNKSKLYPSVMPDWDNTSRRNNKGLIFNNSSPKSYANWLDSAIKYVNDNDELEENVIFINAWNEWGESAYLEPDRRNGFSYLDMTYKTIFNNIKDDESKKNRIKTRK